MLDFQINPTLNLDALAAAFRKHQRLQIIDFIMPECAELMASWLDVETAWSLSYNNLEKSFELSQKARAKLTQTEFNELFLGVYAQASVQFQYLFERHHLLQKTTKKQSKLDTIGDFMNSSGCLAALRHITGHPNIDFADAQATRYGPGHFLKRHTDTAPEQNRLAAYVLNLSREWQADWGGQLQFIGADGRVVETCLPRLGALNLFAVPQPHAVSFVPPYCPAKRHSVTGWLRSHS